MDPIHVGAALYEPQRWNRYAYAGNNPLKYVDPSGLTYEAFYSTNATSGVAIFYDDDAFWKWVMDMGFRHEGSVRRGRLVDSAGVDVGSYQWTPTPPPWQPTPGYEDDGVEDEDGGLGGGGGRTTDPLGNCRVGRRIDRACLDALEVSEAGAGGIARVLATAAAKGVEAALKLRPDIVLSGGRRGQLVKNLEGPANSVLRGRGGRASVTNADGKVILDITKDRVKPVTPGRGFGRKRAPTAEELSLLERVLGGG